MPPEPSIDAAKNLLKPHEAVGPTSPDAPRAPFKTNMVLTREQENSAMGRLDQWETALKSASGWDETGDEANYIYTGEGSDPLMIENRQERRHFVKRACYRAMAENRWEWRRWMFGTNSIFAKQNLNAPLARRISRSMAAKAGAYFFGTKPYFVCYPVGPSDESVSEAIQKVAEIKLDKSKGSAALRDALQSAFDLGESVLKVSHKRRSSLYRKFGEVLGDAAGNPVLRADGEYITRKDDSWIPDAAGKQVLAKDGVTPYPDGAQWLTGSWARVVTHYNGPEIQEIYYRNFLAPLDAPDLQSAECLLHIYEVTPAELATMFTASNTGAQIVQAVELLRGLAEMDTVGATDPVAGDDQPKTTKVKVQEFWCRMDADGDGMTEDVCFVRVNLGGDGWHPLFYDYVQNVTETKERPFYTVAPIRRRGSWTGIGALEMFENHQQVVDLMLNRWSFATSSAGHITIFDPEAFEETSGENPDLDLGNGGYYRLKPGKVLDQALKRIYLEDTIGPAWQGIMQFFLQLAMNESGVQHANDGAMAGMDTTKLATGIRNVEASGNETFGVFVACLEDGINDAIQAFVQTLYGRISGKEVARTLEDNVPQVFTVDARDVEGLQFDVQVMLSRYRSEQMMQSVRNVLPDCMAYYQLPIPVQVRLMPLFHQLLKSAQINNPDKIIAPLMEYTPEQLMASMQYAMSLPPEFAQNLAPMFSVAASVVGMPEQQPAAAAA